MTKNEYTTCSTYTSAGDLTTDTAGNYTYHPHNYNQCIGCKHKDCPYWRPPCHKRRRCWPWPYPYPYYPYRRYYPWWEWNTPYSPTWTTGTATWTADPGTTVTYTNWYAGYKKTSPY